MPRPSPSLVAGCLRPTRMLAYATWLFATFLVAAPVILASCGDAASSSRSGSREPRRSKLRKSLIKRHKQRGPVVTTPPPRAPTPPTPPTPPPTSPAVATPQPTRFSGASGTEVGCIPCDHLLRFLTPGRTGITRGRGADTARQRSVRMPHRGALGNLTIETTVAEGGVWMFELWVEGEPSFVGCRLGILQTTCQSVSTRSVREGDRVTLAIGNPGRPFDTSAGRGRFRVRYGFELTR